MNSAQLVKELEAAWSAAQKQLAEIREQVTLTTELANAKADSRVIKDALDEAYRELGKAVWKEVARGKLRLGPSLSGVKAAVQKVRASHKANKAKIVELLTEEEAEVTNVVQLHRRP